MQLERDNDVLNRLQAREDQLHRDRLAHRSHRDRVRQDILARLSDHQLRQDQLKAAKDQAAAHREQTREQKLEQQKKEFTEKLREKAKMRAMRRAQAKQHAESFHLKVDWYAAEGGKDAERGTGGGTDGTLP